MPASAPGSAPATGTTATQPTRRAHKTRYQQEEEAMGGPIQRRTDISTHGNWRFGRMIGKGASGRVKLAHHMITQQVACVKIVPKSAILTSRVSLSAIAEGAEKDERLMMAIEREICIMKLIDHPHLVKLLDVFETDADMYMLLEYVPNGELFDHICSRGRLPVAEALHYFRQIMRGVDYCHRFSVAHRDLKPENLLLDEDMNVKIADFGMATFQRDDALLETSCGSPHYAAPEIISGKPYHGSAADIWSCGIILHALLTGRLPFDDPNIRILLKKVKEGKFDMPRTGIPYEAQDLMRRMIEIDPAKRIKMLDIFKHPFFISANPPMSCLPDVPTPPTRDELSHPIYPKSTSELEIVKGMRALWRHRDEDEILQALFDNEGNWEKVFYWLLCKYQDRLRALNGNGSFANESGSSTQSDSTPTPTKETPNPVSPRSSHEVRRLIHETPTPPYRGVTTNRVPIMAKNRTPPPAVPLPPVPKEASRPRTAGKCSPRSFLPVFDDHMTELSGNTLQSTSPMEIDTPEKSHQTSCVTTSPMKVDAFSGSVYAATVSSDSTDDRDAAAVNHVLDICASSTPKSAAPHPDLSLPHIEEQATLRDELIGLGLHLAMDTTMMSDLLAQHTPPAKQTRAEKQALERPSTALQAPAPSTLPSTVMGLRVPELHKSDVAMQEFFRALKLKTEGAEPVASREAIKQAESQDVPHSPRIGGNDSTWVNISPPSANVDHRATAAGYRRRSVAPCPQPPQRTKTMSVSQAPPTTSVRSPRSARITFSPELHSRAEPDYRPSSSHQRRMTVLSYSIQPRNHSRSSEDKENIRGEDMVKARRNTGVGNGYPGSQNESMRRVSEVAMPGAFSGIGAPLVPELQTRRYQPPAVLNFANVHAHAPYMHPGAQHFHPVHQHPYQQPSAFFSPPPSRFGSPPLSIHTQQYHFPASQSPPLPTPVSTTGSENKVNWLASLFRGKGERYHLTSSMGIIDTRTECQRLLRSMEVYTLMEEEGGPGSGTWSLKCWTTESLASPWFKTVKFRIQFSAGHSLTPPGSNPLLTPITPSVAVSPDPNQNYSGPTVMTFTLEKGASATLRAVFARLRAEWSGTGSLRSPELGAATGLGIGAFAGNAGYMPLYE
ncbi:Pkinase-domain-containing protein [Calocera viscosa TUFC12733]|uniref:non-specific serine/threonine protein kinase n=1 Tax=Calocera viscosa (strain TUFC12733) TaxID=1330018 RepID=A0A167JRE1_CALVF|nr:Pkinase-domain-containing protein [Calocera viscosa TUFC12733]